MAEMALAASDVPTYKFLPLAYQLASRLCGPGRNRALEISGFSVRLPLLQLQMHASSVVTETSAF